MGTRTTIYTDDGGNEIARTVEAVADANINNRAIEKWLRDKLPVVDGHISTIKAEIAAFPGYNNAQVASSLSTKVLPALRDALIGLGKIARMELGEYGSVGQE